MKYRLMKKAGTPAAIAPLTARFLEGD